MNDARHLALLRAVVKLAAERVESELAAPDADPARFLAFAARHGLAGYVFLELSRLGLLGRLSPAVAEQGKLHYLRQWRQGELLARELARLDAVFGRAGVPVLWLKGPLLAQRYYGDVAARAMSDLDVLVATKQDLDRAERLLLEAGYAPRYRLLLGRRVSRFFTHHFLYRKDDLPVEVHWALQRHFTFRLDYREIWESAASVRLGDRTYRATSGEYELVLRIVGALTDLQVSGLSLKPFVDMYRIAKAIDDETDWDAFFRRRRAERILPASTFFVGLMLELLGSEEELRRMADALECLPGHSRSSLRTGASYVLHGRPTDFRQKLFALGLYDTSLAAALGWWAVSLPFRLAVYRDAGTLER